MDSLTQITLGAAVGELVLGKKIGNKAMLWGAIGGTIPDLDVLANFVTDEMSSLAYHRAFTHSLTFGIITPFILGALVHRLYGGKESFLPDKRWQAFALSWGLLFLMIFLGSQLMPLPIYNVPQIALLVSTVIMVFPLFSWFKYAAFSKSRNFENPGWLAWTHLFFWSIFTHPLLDACTTYGTQLLEPFSSLRVAWNSISVADPLYTVPFLICILIASFFSREKRQRKWFTWAGIIISSAYLAFAFLNLNRVEKILETDITTQNISAKRYITTPSIFNNILWRGTVESDEGTFHIGEYSFFDQQPTFSLREVPQNMHLIKGHKKDRDLEILQWFSNGYFNITIQSDSVLQYNDLRFGSLPGANGEEESAVFYWLLKPVDGELRASQVEDFPEGDASDIFGLLWKRIKGI